MSIEAIRPSTLDGIKRLAKSIKAERDIQHNLALDTAAQSAGFQNFRHARNALKRNVHQQLARPGHSVYLTTYWRDNESGAKGRETLRLELGTVWSDLITPKQLIDHRALDRFRPEGSDHLAQRHLAGSQSQARRDICAAARTLQFMDATKLRPSKSHSRAFPDGDSSNAVPGRDHSSIWYDPTTKRYLFADEPYERAAESKAAERAQWSERHGFPIIKPSWPGMYNPDGGSRLYLIADSQNGIPLPPLVAALARLPSPIVEATWNGESAPATPVFRSPGTIALDGRLVARPRREPSKRSTINYAIALSGRGRRPKGRMPIDAHEKIGELLKSVLVATHYRKGAYNRVNSVRCELDNWTQCEYTGAELSNERFFDIYYHESGASLSRKISTDEQRHHVDSLENAKSILVRHYPDCPPLRALLRKLDAAVKSLQEWA